jgi:hypothetical protein
MQMLSHPITCSTVRLFEHIRNSSDKVSYSIMAPFEAALCACYFKNKLRFIQEARLGTATSHNW